MQRGVVTTPSRRRPDDRRVQMPVKLEPALILRIDEECDRLVVSRSKLLELAITRWLDGDLPPATRD